MKPHKHAELIKAWADGAEIEACVGPDEWWVEEYPDWHPLVAYRIKPQPKTDIVYYGVFDHLNGQHEIGCCFSREQDESIDQLKIVFDGETGKIKSVVIL
jgi:hypothetical protein